MFIHARTILFVLACAGLAACATPSPPAGDEDARRTGGSGVAYREGNVRIIKYSAPRVDLKGAPRLGSPAARIGIIEFSNYQCPYCRHFHQQQFARIRKEYIDTGLVQFMHRDLPLKMHPHAVPAAVAARCARAQGRFWDMHDALLDNQGRLGPELYAKLAREMKLDEVKFSACLGEPVHEQGIARDLFVAKRLGFSGTPSFLIGTIEDDTLTVVREARGAPAFELFAQEIEKLRQSGPRAP